MSPEKNQSEKFRDLAKKAECEDDEAAFEEKLRRIAGKSLPKDEKYKRRKPAK